LQTVPTASREAEAKASDKRLSTVVDRH
jgi:hypothetical protein